MRAAKADTLPGPLTARCARTSTNSITCSNLTGEIVIAQGRLRQMIEELGTEQGRAILEMHREAERLYMDLQSEVMSIRMVPVGPLFRQFVRSVRDLAKSHGKMARLEVVGADVEVDTTVLEQLKDPLLHLIRNAVDHGLENSGSSREARQESLRSDPAHRRSQWRQHCCDAAGRWSGLRPRRILDKAKRLGLLSASKTRFATRKSTVWYFQAGFSTAESVTDLSGRGVGLDVVRRNIDNLRGTVEIIEYSRQRQHHNHPPALDPRHH